MVSNLFNQSTFDFLLFDKAGLPLDQLFAVRAVERALNTVLAFCFWVVQKGVVQRSKKKLEIQRFGYSNSNSPLILGKVSYMREAWQSSFVINWR